MEISFKCLRQFCIPRVHLFLNLQLMTMDKIQHKLIMTEVKRKITNDYFNGKPFKIYYYLKSVWRQQNVVTEYLWNNKSVAQQLYKGRSAVITLKMQYYSLDHSQ